MKIICRERLQRQLLAEFKQRHFDPGAKLNVIPVNSEGTEEGAVDDGGPTRE